MNMPNLATLNPLQWTPAVDIYRCGDHWLLKFDLAGVRPQDVEIRAQGRHLTVSGSRRDWTCQASQRCYSMEIAYSRFQRSVALPCSLDKAHIETEFDHGLLLVRLSHCNGD